MTWAELASGDPPFKLTNSTRGARGRGNRYERKAQKHLETTYEGYVPCKWLRFTSEDSPRPRWCQPDGIHLDFQAGICTIVEIKWSHQAKAWWQIRQLYQPVLERLFQDWDFASLEVVGWYDPEVFFPENHRRVKDPFSVKPGEFGVHSWRPS